MVIEIGFLRALEIMRDLFKNQLCIRIFIVGLTGFLVLFAPAADARADETDELEIKYKAVLKGAPDETLKALLTGVSETFDLEETPPASAKMLKRRVEEDLPRMKKAMRSKGYLKAEIDYRLDREADPVNVIFTVTPGPPFILQTVEITLSQPDPQVEVILPKAESLGLESGRRYEAEKIIEAQQQLLTALGKDGYPFPEIADRKIVADMANDTIEVFFRIDPGVKAVFGPTELTGLTGVEEDYLRRLLPWKTGDPYNAALVAKGKSALLKTGLFSTVQISVKEVDSDDRAPILISLTERKFRTVRAGVGYTSDKGLEGRLGWEHRNLLGSGEKLEASLRVNEVEQILKTKFRKPGFFSPDQSLFIAAEAARERTDAYNLEGMESSAGIERQLSSIMSASAGVRYQLQQVENGDKETYGLFSVPVNFKLDYANDLFDPSKGGRLNIWGAPYTDTLGNSQDFFKYWASYSHYFELLKNKRFIFAGRTLYGSISGAGLSSVPKHERFYSGGGGSVRGYAYQNAGTLDGDEPVGGRSLVELSGEFRFKVAEKFGLVTFLDGGRAFSGTTPGKGEKLFWGTGLGLRYYTPIGPVRLDVAFPLNRRDDVDAAYQIYISLGQAF